MPEPLSTAAAMQADALSGYSVSTFLWGIIGSAVSMRFVPQMGFWQKATAVASGTAMAIAGTPIIKLLFGIQEERVLFGVSFFVGVFGLSLAASTFDAIKNTKWKKIIESRLGKSSGKTGDD